MGLPVKLSDGLIALAREQAALADRSLTAQIEHWARLGQRAEFALTHKSVMQLKQGLALTNEQARRALAQAFGQVLGGESQDKADRLISASGKPLYATDPKFPGCVVQVWPDGRRVPGKFDGKGFVPAEVGFRPNDGLVG